MRPLPYVAQLERLPKPRITAATLRKMHDLARKAKTNWKWIRLNTRLVSKCPSKDYACEADTLFRVWHGLIWRARRGKYRLRYIRDPHQVELVESVWHLLERRGSDCDGLSALFAGAAGAIGFPYRFVTIAADPSRPGDPSHVFAQVLVKGVGWMSADLTVPKATLGWEPKGYEYTFWPEPKYK